MKKLLLILITILCLSFSIAFAGCSDNGGEDPTTIEISIDGYWVINGVKTEHKAIGTDGANGTDGQTPTIEISSDGYWVLNGTKTEFKVVIEDGEDGKDGANGVGVKSVAFDDQGRLVITLTDDTTLPPIEMPQKQEHVHNYGDWLVFTEGEEVPCNQRMYYRVCGDCNHIDLRQGTNDDHKWQENYIIDKTYHWKECDNCQEIKDKEEHTPDDSGYCSKCDYASGATVGVNYQLSFDRTYAEVVGYEGSSSRIILASEYQGKPVKSIYKEAFSDKSITSIIIPESVTKIGEKAFYNCTALESIKVSDCVQTIGSYAFDNCNESLYVVENNLKYLNVNDKPYYVLVGVEDNTLTACEINSQTQFVGSYAFDECNALSTIVIPASVKHVGAQAFNGCSSLQTVKYGASLSSWENIVVDNGNDSFINATRFYADVVYTYFGGSLSATATQLSSLGNGESVSAYATYNHITYNPTSIEILGDGANYITVEGYLIKSKPNVSGEAKVNITYEIDGYNEKVEKEYSIVVVGEKYDGNAIKYSALDKTMYFDQALTDVGVASLINATDCTLYYSEGSATDDAPQNIESKVLADNTLNCVITLSDGSKYAIDMVCYTKIITKSSDFLVFNGNSGEEINGYFIVENDVKLDDTWSGNIADNNSPHVFKGLFDGQGHTVEIALKKYGIFGSTDGAEIKNTAFIVKELGAKTFAYASTLAYQMSNTTVSDCYFKYDLPSETTIDIGYYGYGQSSGLGLYATPGDQVKLTNVVIDTSKVKTSCDANSQPYAYGSIVSKARTNSTGVGGGAWQPETNNVYVFSADKYLGYYASVTATSNTISSFNGIQCALFASNDITFYRNCIAETKALIDGTYRYDSMASALTERETFSGLTDSESGLWSLDTNGELAFNGTVLGSVDVTNFISNSTSEYAIVVPNTYSTTGTTALDYAITDLHDYVSLATNGCVDLPIVKASNFIANAYPKYFSIGNTGLMTADVTDVVSTLGEDGLFYFSEGDNVYFTGKSTYGVANGVYDFLRTYFGFDAITNEVVVYDENVTDVSFTTLYKIDVPEIAERFINGVDARTRARFGARNGYMGYGIGGLYTDLNCTAWEIPSMHNTLDYIPYSKHKTEHGAYWYATDENNAIIGGTTPKDICYTAHGNASQYTAMVNEYVARIKQIFKQREDLKIKKAEGRVSWANTSWNILTIMTEDNGVVCKCSSCLEAKELYGGYVTGALIKFINNVKAGVDAWFETSEGSAYKIDDFGIMFSAYQGYIDAPVKYDEALGKYVPIHKDVVLADGVVLQIATSESSGLSPYYSIHAEENAKGKATIEKWATLVNKINLWTYQANFSNYLYFGDSFELFNEEGYKFFADNKVNAWVNQNSNGMETSWALLKEYISSKLMWDTSVDLEEIYDNYFNAVYGTASVAMRNLFDMQREAFQDALASYATANPGLSAAGYANIFNGYYDDEKLKAITDGYKTVLDTVEVGSYAYYQIIKEAISPYFIALTNRDRHGALAGTTPPAGSIQMDATELARIQTLKVEFKQMLDAYEAVYGKMHRTEHTTNLSSDIVYNSLGYYFRPSNNPTSLLIYAFDCTSSKIDNSGRVGSVSSKTLTGGVHNIGWHYGYPDGKGHAGYDFRNVTIELVSGLDVVELTLGVDADGHELKWNNKTYMDENGCLPATQSYSARYQLGVINCKQAGTAVLRLHYDLDGMHYTYDLTLTITE
ncbi:MAG: DUF4838 domain-containing protein [Clostridia bacterium]|nr:DUF4838 domain-containing protein [Clostridia bacterium]